MKLADSLHRGSETLEELNTKINNNLQGAYVCLSRSGTSGTDSWAHLILVLYWWSFSMSFVHFVIASLGAFTEKQEDYDSCDGW